MENADKRLLSDDAIELALLGAIDTATSDFTSDICNKQRHLQLSSTWHYLTHCVNLSVFWPPHQTGRTSNCGAQFPQSPCCRRCRNRCLSSRPCPWAATLHCPGTYPPRRPHESKSLCWDPAQSCNDTHARFSSDNLIHRDQSADSQRCVKNFIYLPWLSVLCRRGFILRAGISFWGDSCWAD